MAPTIVALRDALPAPPRVPACAVLQAGSAVPFENEPSGAQLEAVADDPAVAAPWFHALRNEGINAPMLPLDLRQSGREPAPGLAGDFAMVLHVSRRLPDSLGALRRWREREPARPLMVVCQQLRDIDHVLALEMGADDVIDAATAPTVVAARLRALVRRRTAISPPGPAAEHYRFGALALHLRERRVELHGRGVALTEGEFEVLWLLASVAGQPVSRADLLRRLRGLPYHRIDRSIDSRVYRLRAKLGDADGPAQRIRTVRNCGYLFSPAPW